MEHASTFTLDRGYALQLVLSQLGLPFRKVAAEGAPYPDGDAVVPKGHMFVTYDTGNYPGEYIWGLVEQIAPQPQVDGRR